jgi:hypothetical protein
MFVGKASSLPYPCTCHPDTKSNSPFSYLLDKFKTVNDDNRGARYLMGENLKVVWAEFSILS